MKRTDHARVLAHLRTLGMPANLLLKCEAKMDLGRASYGEFVAATHPVDLQAAALDELVDFINYQAMAHVQGTGRPGLLSAGVSLARVASK